MQCLNTIAPRPSLTQRINSKQKYNSKESKERIHLMDVHMWNSILNPSLTLQDWIHYQSSWMSKWMISKKARTMWIFNLRKISQKISSWFSYCVILKLISNLFLNKSSAAKISGLGNLPNRLLWVIFQCISAVPSDNPLVKCSIH